MITAPLHWKSILSTAIRAKIASPFFHQLQSLGLDQRIPPAVRGQFKKYYYKIGYQNIRIFEQLAQLIRLLAEARVDVIVLKGAALQAEIWPKLSLREMADIDLLIRFRDLEVAEYILQKNGFLPMEEWNPAQYYRKYHHHLVPYFNPKAAYRLPVEIHHNIKQPTDPVLVDMSAFWKSSRTISFIQTELHVLSPENLLVHLCLDWTYNKLFLGHIRYLLDISQTVSHFGSAMQWDHIVMLARTPGMANYIYYALYFSKILLGATIPQKVLNQIGIQVSVKSTSHHLLRYLVKQYCLVFIADPPLIPIYKLQRVCRDIITGADVTEKIKTFWYDFLILEKLTESGERVGACRRAAFIGHQLIKNLYDKQCKQ
jgi:hypothetical protein